METTGIRFDEREDGVYLVVAAETELTLSDLLGQVRERGIGNYDEGALQEALGQRRGRPVRIGDLPVRSEPARIRVRMSDDAMRAEIFVSPPLGEGPWPTDEELRATLQGEKILFGVRE